MENHSIYWLNIIYLYMHGELFKLQDFFLGGQHEDVSWLKDECCALDFLLQIYL